MSEEQTKITFTGFPKIPRFSRDCVITCKIDGTNASVLIHPVPKDYQDNIMLSYWVAADGQRLGLFVGSRTRWIVPGNDNFGFAFWVYQHLEEIKTLGIGHHVGEWFGAGIQRKYGLKEKRWALFNTFKWITDESKRTDPAQVVIPPCVTVVPVLTTCNFDVINQAVDECMEDLRTNGSRMVPGFFPAEGIVIYHIAGNTYYKKTLVGDEKPKGKQ